MKYTGGEGEFPKYNNTNIGFILFLRFTQQNQPDCGPDCLSYKNLLDYLLVILTGLTLERS